MASTTLARTQPLVVQPATSRVCTPRCASHAASMVPWKADGTFLRTTYSPGAGVSSGTMALAGDASFSVSMPGTLMLKMLPSASSSA